MLHIVARSEVVQTDFLGFEEPTYSLKGYTPVIVTADDGDAISETMIESEDEDESEEEEESEE